MRAFWELSSTRSFGEAIGPIPWDKIVAYGYHRGYDKATIRVLEIVIRELDEVWLKTNIERQRQRQNRTLSRPKVPKSG